MGVKLGEIVPKEEISWDLLKGKTLAVDASNVFYQFVSSIRQPDGTPLSDSRGRVTSHLVGLFSRIPNLIGKGIKLCFVFDGKAPELKKRERERRHTLKVRAAEKYEEAKEREDIEAMGKYARQVSMINSDMIEEAKELIKALGIPVVQAPSEAEAQAAYMCRKKDVWAVASQDYDALLHRAPRVVMNLTLSQRKRLPSGGYVKVTPELVEFNKLLDKLEITDDQLIVLAILVGTDYNVKGVKGIGPKKALQLVQSGKSFDEIFSSLDVKFDWKEIFDLFKNMAVTDDYKIEFGDIDEQKIKEILVEEHDFSKERVESTLKKLKEYMNPEQTGLNKWF